MPSVHFAVISNSVLVRLLSNTCVVTFLAAAAKRGKRKGPKVRMRQGLFSLQSY
jgi:hypothetical protein